MWQAGEKRNAYRVWVNKLKTRDRLEDLSVDGRIILKLIFKKEDGRAPGFMWPRRKPRESFWEFWNKPSVSTRCGGFFEWKHLIADWDSILAVPNESWPKPPHPPEAVVQATGNHQANRSWSLRSGHVDKTVHGTLRLHWVSFTVIFLSCKANYRV